MSQTTTTVEEQVKAIIQDAENGNSTVPLYNDGFDDLRNELKEAFDEVWQTSVKCVYISPHYRTTVILWIFLTRMLGFINHAPILLIDAIGPGCGKTTLSKFAALLCGSDLVSRHTNFTKAGLQKLVSKIHFLDEFDSIETKHRNGVSNHLNSCYENSGATAINAHGSTSNFCFYSIAGINLTRLLEPTTLSRSVHVRVNFPPQHVKLALDFAKMPKDHLYETSRAIDDMVEKYSDKLQHYFKYVEYPQKKALTNRSGDVWRNLFDLATLIGEECVERLMTCVSRQIEPVDFPDEQYFVSVRQYKEPDEPTIYDGSEVVCTDSSTNDFLTAVKAVLEFYRDQSSTGIHTKVLFELVSKLNVQGAPVAQRSMARYMTSLGINFNKNVDRNSGYRFDETNQILDTTYRHAIDHDLYEEYLSVLKS
ncbi:ATP-binding protein [Acinetobacter baumannii]|uniref:ATP-binding protein n=2 Tax=Acinetobacter baumannii TaxID=470 RepID=UPI001BFECA09|nr:ATP-binding protein [Acinetobacter baumannii]MBT8176416.1 ATP-binding protein [Acinetobacter baumannii]